MDNNISIIIKIQKLYRKNKCIKATKEFLDLDLINLSKNKDFEKFKRLILGKQINNVFIKLCKSYNNYKKININNRVLSTLLFFYFYPNDLLSSKHNNLDCRILELSKLFIKNISNFNINLLCNILNDYNTIFKSWVNMDKCRLLEDCIKSYYFKCEHLEKIQTNELIKKSELHDKDQVNDMINELEKQKKGLLINIQFIDKTFDIKYFEQNYKEVYTKIVNTKQDIETSIVNNMKLAYYDMLCNDIKKGDMISTLNLIKEIGEKLITICPINNKENFKNKFNINHITELLIDHSFNPKINKFIFMMIDFIILMDAPIHDDTNKQLRDQAKLMINNSSKTLYQNILPQILINISEHIDRLYVNLLNQ
jgi:hypothetical protein